MSRSRIKSVACGISGGVDSAVAAHLLKKNGFNVIGVFMKNWDARDEIGTCQNQFEDLDDARKVSKHLQIPLIEVSFIKDYWNNVFNTLIQDYEVGMTPNPDVLCNRYVKFGSFYDYSMNNLGVDFISTGHYARTSNNHSYTSHTEDLKDQDKENRKVKLLRAIDLSKDQTLFLSQVKQTPLKRTIFPLGNLLKSQVRRIAKEIELYKIAQKSDSTGICFIGNRKFTNFIGEYIPDKIGHFIDVDSGQIIGEHRGVHHWTLGQRCLIGGLKEARYIAYRDTRTQTILVSPQNHRILYTDSLLTNSINWIEGTPPEELQSGQEFKCLFKFQHTEWMIPCQVKLKHHNQSENSFLEIKLSLPTRALTAGQYAVLYKNNVCLGSSKIIQVNIDKEYCSLIDDITRKNEKIHFGQSV